MTRDIKNVIGISSGLLLVLLLSACGGSSGSNDSPTSSSSISPVQATIVPVSNGVAFIGNALQNQFPRAIQIDSKGNVWLSGLTAVIRIDPFTATPDCSSGCTKYTVIPFEGLTVDSSDNVWLYGQPNVLNPDSSILKITTTTNKIAVLPNTMGTYPELVFDNNGNIWASDISTASMLDEYDTSGTVMNQYHNAAILGTSAMAVDANNNIWLYEVDASATTTSMVYAELVEYVSGTSTSKTYKIDTGRDGSLNSMAIDNNGNVWVVNKVYSGASVMEIQAGAPSSCASGCVTYTLPNSLVYPSAIAIDGANNVWVASMGPTGKLGNIVKISPGAASDCSSGCTVYTSPLLIGPTAIALDSSGNVWTINLNNLVSNILELPGLAAPTVTPIVAQTR